MLRGFFQHFCIIEQLPDSRYIGLVNRGRKEFNKEVAMKLASGISLFVLFMGLSFPVTSVAFSRRSQISEVGPQSAPLNTSHYGDRHDVSPQAVPEPPVLFLMSIGVGLLGIGAMFKHFRPSA